MDLVPHKVVLIRSVLTGWGGRECWKENMCLNLEAKPGLVLDAVGVVHSLIVQMINQLKYTIHNTPSVS